MSSRLRWITATLAAATAASLLHATPASAAGYSAPLRTAVTELSVASETRTG